MGAAAFGGTHMSRKIPGNQSHLSDSDRAHIEEALNRNLPFTHIARFLFKDPSTIAKEVKKHRVFQKPNHFNDGARNQCLHRPNCEKRNLCQTGNCRALCRRCSNCNAVCPDFTKDVCRRLQRAPYVCNGCDKKQACRREKAYYRCTSAYKAYRQTLVTARQGVNISFEQMAKLDTLVTPLLKRGQSPAHVFATHESEIPISMRSLYRYIDQQHIGARNIDLPRKVRFRPRKRYVNRKPLDRAVREERNHDHFLAFLAEHPDASFVEMDTVEGRKAGKVLLTFFLRSCRLQLAFLLERKTKECVTAAIAAIRQTLGADSFAAIFSVLLTDNGSEFLDPLAIEEGGGCRVFFCNPNSSWQKGALERNHELLRYVLPKGTSFDRFTQDHIALLVNHVNGLCRNSLHGKSPFQMADFLLPSGSLHALGCLPIPPDQVTLIPQLLTSFFRA